MEKSFYLDACIWRDYFESRSDGLRPFGEFAFRFLKCCVEKKAKIFYSEVVLFELYYLAGQFEEYVEQNKGLFVFVNYSKENSFEARALSKSRGVSFNDALQAIIARENNLIVITRDKHFVDLYDIAASMAPEEVSQV